MSYPRRGLHGEIVERIGQLIVSGAIAPGSPVDPAQLEVDLGVSRTVVREALKTLAAKGLVDARPKRGTYVRPRSDWALLDADLMRWQFAGRRDEAFLASLAEVRSIVEPAGARLAALRRTDADLTAMSAALDRMVASAADPAAHTQADLVFHRALLAAAHNELLERMEVVITFALQQRDLMVHAGGLRDAFAPTHQAVLDAVQAGDPEAAETAMRALLAQATLDESAGVAASADAVVEGGAR